MKIRVRSTAVVLLLSHSLFLFACRGEIPASSTETNSVAAIDAVPTATAEPASMPSKYPILQAQLLEPSETSTGSPLGGFDFKNFKYPLPRGWQDSDGKDVELVAGKRAMEKSDDVERIGLSYFNSRFFDLTGDGQDEAVVILKIDTGGSAIPLLVYVFTWKNGEPELLWHFRTGDRADGGLKSVRTENGFAVIELYGQDRYIVGELDTAKITGDEEQLCCPTHFTQSRYKWNGTNFRLEGKRLTYLTADKNAAPIENMVEQVERQNGGKK